MDEITPDLLLNAYANGYFPMAMEKDDPELYWFSPEERGVLPIAEFNIPRGLKRSMKTRPYTVTVDRDFEAVIRGCGEINGSRDGTWINEKIVALYCAVHAMGHAHSVEVWENPSAVIPGLSRTRSEAERDEVNPREPNTQTPGQARGDNQEEGSAKLIGGLYGISLGGAFFGESMFSRAPDASKIALVHLVEILREANYLLLDTQYVNDHLKQFGVEAVPKEIYMAKLAKALKASPNPSTFFSTVSVRKGLASASSATMT